MTTSPSTPASNTSAATEQGPLAENKQIVLKEIGAKWSQCSEHHLSSRKNEDDLVA
ncbi:MAG: hypothetical protein WA397_11805 [Roseiarcus sp.]